MTRRPPTRRFRLVRIAILILAFVVAFFSLQRLITVLAQSGCTQGDTPSTTSGGRRDAWAQNALVSVNVDSNSFTQAQFNNCIKPLFDAFNLVNGATQGNASGVRFSVTFGRGWH